uniref:SFRICE_015094 n=1 Tax=Spodoptera frugiperda TaxID=7108 RepID=A0A2H1WFH8_SPOFR
MAVPHLTSSGISAPFRKTVKLWYHFGRAAGNRADASPDGKQSRPPKDTQNTRSITSALSAFWGLGIYGRMLRNWGLGRWKLGLRTSAVCGRTLQYQYQSFKNYCMLDFVNCREGHEIWQILHMGKCYKLKDLTENEEFLYSGDSFLSKDYVIDRHQWKLQDMPRYVQERDQ